MAFSAELQHLVRENEHLAPYCWLRIGGSARYFAEPNSLSDFCLLIKEASEQSLSIRLLGDGSNVLVRETGVDGLVIHMSTAELCMVELHGGKLIAKAGAKLNHVISAAVGAGLSGLEQLAGIPGTIGAAVASNAGVTNDDLGSRVTAVQVCERNGELKRIDRQDLQFGFRRSNLDDAFITEVELSLEAGDPQELTRRMQSSWIIRRAAQPQSGSRTVQAILEPDGTKLSALLDEAGVRDARHGDVALVPQHPGFLTVAGDTTSSDVIAFLSQITRTVEAKTGIQLQSQLKIW